MDQKKLSDFEKLTELSALATELTVQFDDVIEKLEDSGLKETLRLKEEMAVVRKNPNHFPVNSPSYWRAVANATVRTYVCLFPEPKTFDGVCQAIAQSNLKSIRGNCGESSVVVLLDLDLLGESMGPACQPNLRKQFQAQPSLLSKLVHGAMVARGSQKVNDEGQATAVVEGDLVMVHIGVGRSKREVKALFAVPGGKQQRTDSELKESIITYNDEALRTRKKRVKGSYCGHSVLVTASVNSLSQSVPERTYDFHAGSCWSDVLANVKALPASELWHTPRTSSAFSVRCLFFIFSWWL